jgi:hypothetical protein
MNCRFLIGPLVCLGLVVAPAAADYLLIRVNTDRVALPDGSKVQAAMQAGQQALGSFGGAEGGAMIGNPAPGAGQVGAGVRGVNPMAKGFNPMQPMLPGEVGDPSGAVAADEFDPKSPWIGAFIEIKKMTSQGPLAKVDTRFGEAYLPLHPALKGNLYFGQVRKDPFSVEFARRFKRAREKPRAEDLLNLADWALARGLTKKETPKPGEKEMKPPLDRVIDEVAKIDPKHTIVKRFNAVREQLKKPLPDTDPDFKLLLEEMVREGYRAVSSQQGHYVLLSNLPGIPQTDAILRRRLAQLEDAFEHFYLWFALQRDLQQPQFQPRLPRGQLVAILATTPEEFHGRHVAWGTPTLAGDGFTPRRDNVMILSGRRLDEDYDGFAKAMDVILENLGVSRDDMLKGGVWDRKRAAALGQNPAKAAGLVYAQPLTLLLRAMEDEAEHQAATHQATRQLLIASGLFPRTVQVPEWILTGLASFFEVPVGSVYGGVGLPSTSNLIALKYYRNKNKLGKGPQVIYNVMTDRYFHTANDSMAEFQGNKDSDQLANKAREDGEIARSTAWALVYYLAQNRKFSHLLRYGQELHALPRDLDLEEKTLQSCFARAFDEVSDPKDARRIEPQKLQQFATEWLGFMQGVNLEEDVVEREYLDLREQKAKADAKAAAAAAAAAAGAAPGGPLMP